MKFCKRYREYMRAWGEHSGTRARGRVADEPLPAVDLKRLKNLLKRCSKQRGLAPAAADHTIASGGTGDCNGRECPVCDGTFFPSLLQEMSVVVRCFNDRARSLLDLHLASGLRKYLLWLRTKNDHDSLIQQGKDLVTYAIINSIAMRKILKKYDKIHYSKQGQAFRSQALTLHIEILQSPWLSELMAFYINTRAGSSGKTWATPGLFDDCSLTLEDDRPVISCGLFDSLKLSIDLTCSICLDTVFDTVALSCGHIFCYICACQAASVSIVDGLKSAGGRAKCPLCRQAGVFNGAMHLEELNILLNRSCHEYWQQRRQTERTERLRLTKEHWDNQCRAFMGI